MLAIRQKNSKLNPNLILSLLLLSTLLFGIAVGINYVSLPLILHQNSIPTSMMGLSSATEILAGILIAKFLHPLSKKIGTLKMMIGFTILHAAIILVISFYQNFAVWLLLIFTSGLSWFCLITLRQSWINQVADDSRRSKIVGIASTVTCIGVALGPLIVKLIGSGNYLNFVISVSFILISCLILFPIRNHQPQIEKLSFENKISEVVKKNYLIFLARFIAEFQNVILAIFTVTYGIAHNYSAEDSVMLLSAYMAIGILDFLIGFYINNKFYKKYFIIGFSGSLISILIFPLAIKSYYTAILIFMIYGWFISLVLVSSISAANNNQKKNNAVAVNSALQICSSIGAIFGILMAGILIQLFGNVGFIITIAFSNIAFLTINFLTKNNNEKH